MGCICTKTGVSFAKPFAEAVILVFPGSLLLFSYFSIHVAFSFSKFSTSNRLVADNPFAGNSIRLCLKFYSVWQRKIDHFVEIMHTSKTKGGNLWNPFFALQS